MSRRHLTMLFVLAALWGASFMFIKIGDRELHPFTLVGFRMALGALAFLIAIHKLEYFLNSKIIGERIKNPVWLTLIALILGERLMGIPGMILAPVVLHFIKVEASSIKIPAKTLEPCKAAAAEYAEVKD